jgi:hypothetical protein
MFPPWGIASFFASHRREVSLLNRRPTASAAWAVPITLFLLCSGADAAPRGTSASRAPAKPSKTVPENFSGRDAALLDELQKAAFDYFWREASPRTGLVKDRANNFGRDTFHVASIAATGFGLAALPIGVERGYVTRQQAEARARRTLRFLTMRMPHEHGWFYHFVHWHTGEREWKCELSSIDTALLVAGALVAGRYFRGGEVDALAQALYRRIDFEWMRTDGGARPDEQRLCMGWKPESGFLQSRWSSYDEAPLLYLLGIGSPTHPIPAECWFAQRRPVQTYGKFQGVALELPLFVHQFPHAFVDFRGRRDAKGFEPWRNSVLATRVNHQFCIDQQERYRGYGPNSWGISASDGPDGYRAYAPAAGLHDGTLTPWVVAASLPFAPEICLPALHSMRRTYGDRLWGRYGFSDAFNVDRDWWDREVIGIDHGAALLMMENARTGRIWRLFMADPAIQRAVRQAGLRVHASAKPAGVRPAGARR